MAEESGQGDRTEEATPQRRDKAREDGQMPRSRDLVGGLNLFCGVVALTLLADRLSWAIMRVGHETLGHLDKAHDLASVIAPSLYNLLTTVTPLFAVTTVVSVVTILAQTGIPQSGWLKFDLSRLNPIDRLGHMFKPSMGGWDTVKIIVKIAVVGLAAWRMLYPVWLEVGDRVNFTPAALLRRALSLTGALMLRLGLMLLVLALIDYLISRLRVSRDLRMSKQEVREELRNTEGNPQVKRALRRKARELMRRRLIIEVPKADLVVVNPTHYAVALSYKADRMRAPQVTAKGVDDLALRIRELARSAAVPVITSPRLARDLHRRVAVGREVPADLYKAVAEVLAFVYRIKTRRPAVGAAQPERTVE